MLALFLLSKWFIEVNRLKPNQDKIKIVKGGRIVKISKRRKVFEASN